MIAKYSTVFAFMFTLAFTAYSAEGKNCTLLLKMKVYYAPEFSTGKPSIIPKYFYGSDTLIMSPLNFFGTNLSRTVSEVPKAHASARTYTGFRIASLIAIFGGFGFTVGNMIYQAKIGTDYQNETGNPGSFNPTPFFAGLGVMGGGIVLHFSRHIPLHLSVSAFNKSTNEMKCLYLTSQ
jgi:hypothetical protein